MIGLDLMAILLTLHIVQVKEMLYSMTMYKRPKEQ